MKRQESYENAPMGTHKTIDKKDLFTKKKLKRGIGNNHHDISPEFRDLGYLSALNRTINYFP